MKVLLHICCGPCAIYPVQRLRDQGHSVTGYFYRSNIHPYTECMRRQETLEDYARKIELPLICQQQYDLEGFLRNAAFRETERCRLCYHDRLQSAAYIARRGEFNAFSTTLLYSKFQRHDLIRTVGEAVARQVGVPFLYEDYRAGWRAGIETSKELGMYRQQYCGCIYSEKERFYKGRRPKHRPHQKQPEQ